MLRFSSARNDIIASQAAMAACLEQALAGLPGRTCDLVFFHTTVGHDFTELLAAAKRICPEAEIVGCTCGGVVGNDGVSERMRALTLMCATGRDEFAVAHADAIRGANSFEIAKATAEALRAKNPAINMINIVASGIDIAGDRAIEGIEAVFGGDTPIFGGTSSDNMQARVSYQFVGETILERGIVLVGYADPTLRLVSGVHHGNLPIGKPFEVTRAHENRIFELDGKPAWPTLMDALGMDVNVAIADTFAVGSLGQAMPEELRDAYGNDLFIHTVFKVDEERQSFYTPASVSEGTQLHVMRRDEQHIFDGLDRMVAKLKDDIGEARPVAMFHTDCAARGHLKFDQILKDEIIRRMQEPIFGDDPLPWIGLYGFGEFTPLAGKNRFHTQTSSLYALMRDQ